LPTPFETICRHCGLPHTTVKCDQKWARQIKSFDYIFPYTEPLRHWITSLKYSRNLIAGKVLQKLVSLWISENSSKFENVDLLLPIPIPQNRLRSRGFNQTTYLLNSQTILKSDLSIIKKIKTTPPQAGLSKVQRSKANEKSFQVMQDIQGKNILIFDDVCTTGQTISAVSNLLKKAGVGEVRVLVLCRAYSS
jgi:ComF family protein